MPSRLVNLRRTVSWNDFTGQVPANSSHAAHIDTNMNLQYGHASSGGQTHLSDNVVVTVQLHRNQSWAKPGAVRTAALLNHEQRHYAITALMARDFFLDLMQLKDRTFASVAALRQEITRLAGVYASQPVHDQYDPETNHGLRPNDQRRWNCMIDRAFTQPRTPLTRAPDGAVYKIRLLEVIGGNTRACVPATP